MSLQYSHFTETNVFSKLSNYEKTNPMSILNDNITQVLSNSLCREPLVHILD